MHALKTSRASLPQGRLTFEAVTGRVILSLVATLAVVWAAVLALASLLQDRLLYFPARRLDSSPEAWGLRSEELRLTASDGVRLHGWWIRGRGKQVVLLFHGNAGNVSHRLDRAKLFTTRLDVDVWLVDYRGYGLSEGKPSSRPVRDGLAIYDAARERGFPPRVSYCWRIPGCAVAADFALGRPSGLALETPFLSVPALARRTTLSCRAFSSVPLLHGPVGRVTMPKLTSRRAGRNRPVSPLAALLARKPAERFLVFRRGAHRPMPLRGEYLEVWSRFSTR